MMIGVAGPSLVDTGIRTSLSPSFLAVTGVACVLTLLLYAEHPRLSRRAIVAMVPWMVVGSGLSVLAAVADYPSAIRPAVTGVGAYVTAYAVVCLVWFAILQFARGSRQEGGLPTYLGAMGLGAAAMVVGALFLAAGDISNQQLFWLAIAPIVAAAVAALVFLLLGLWYTEAAAYTGIVGALVVFGHALSAIATAVAVVGDAGGHSPLSRAVLNLVATVETSALMGLDLQAVWAWGFVWSKLLLATAVIVGLTTYTQRQPDRGNLVLGLVAAVGIAGGVTVLLSMAVGL